jgi:hypothetical protein
LQIRARAWGHEQQVPLGRLQVIAHGQVLAEARTGQPGQTSAELAVNLDYQPAHGIWIAARVDAGPTQMAHTTPVYVTIGGDGFHTRTKLEAHIELTKAQLRAFRQLLLQPSDHRVTRALAPWNFPDSRARLEQRIADTERTLDALRQRK